eukprot:gene30322-35314_t
MGSCRHRWDAGRTLAGLSWNHGTPAGRWLDKWDAGGTLPGSKRRKRENSFGSAASSLQPGSDEGINEMDEEVSSTSGPTVTTSVSHVAAAAATQSTGADVEPAAPCAPGTSSSGAAAELLWPSFLGRFYPKKHSRAGYVHSRAEWFMFFSCSMLELNCNGMGVLMRPRQEFSDHMSLLVIFNGDCLHYSDGRAVGQLRSQNRLNAVSENSGQAPAQFHGNATLRRSISHQLDNQVSICGASPRVISTARYEVSRKLILDKDQFHSAQLRNRWLMRKT